MKGLLLFFEVVKGLLITGRHLVVNLFRHTLHYLFRLKWVRKGSVTLLYPEERPSLSQRHRSRHRMMFREDGKPRCVACMLCPTICPSDCLFVEAEDVEGDRYAVRFQVDLLGERDVREAVLKERVPPQAPPPLLESEMDRLEGLRLRLMGEAFQPSLPYQEGYRRLLETLRQLFHFWAGLRSRKEGRTRRSDLLLYRLAEYIENKLSEPPPLVDTPGEME